MVTHILDTSAWLAHLFEEPGADQISELFKQNDNQVGVSVASLVEAYARLRAVGRAAEFEWAVDRYRRRAAARLRDPGRADGGDHHRLLR